MIEPFYVNAFFFITGIFLFKKQLFSGLIEKKTSSFLKEESKKYWGSILYSIILPSILFAAVFYVPKILIKTHDYRITSFVIGTIGGGTYWFTSALVVGYLLIFLLLLSRVKNIWFYFCCACIFAPLGAYLGSISELPSWPWMYRQGLIATIYLVSGGIFYKYENRILRNWKSVYTLGLGVLYVVFVLSGWAHYRCTTSLCSFNFLGYAVSVVGSFLLIEVCKRLPNSRFLAFVGENSILFYFLSGGFPLLAARIFGLLPFKNVISLMGVFLCSLLISVLFVMVVKKYFPFLKDFRLLKKN